jgi:hypothetical protein
MRQAVDRLENAAAESLRHQAVSNSVAFLPPSGSIAISLSTIWYGDSVFVETRAAFILA